MKLWALKSTTTRALAAVTTAATTCYLSTSSTHCHSRRSTSPFERNRKPTANPNLKIFSGNATPDLADEVAAHLGTKVGNMTVKPFADGEISVKVHDSVRGQKVYVIQSTCAPVNDNVMELLLMISTLRRASAKEITAIIPYYGYSRSTEIVTGRKPIAGADIAIMLEVAGVDRVVAIDLHRSQLQGCFSPNIPVDNLDAAWILMPYLEKKELKDPVIVSPDANGTARAKNFADKMTKFGIETSFAMIVDSNCEPEDSSKRNVEASRPKEYLLIGDVEGKDVVLVDDMIDSGRRMEQAAEMVKAKGARRVFAYASHGVFTGTAIERLENSQLEEVVILNTIPHDISDPMSKIRQISVGQLVAETIRRIDVKQSVSALIDL